MAHTVKADADRPVTAYRNGAYCRVDHNKNKDSFEEKREDTVVYVEDVMPEVDAPVYGDGGAGDGKEAPPAQHTAMLGAPAGKIQAERLMPAAADNGVNTARLLVEQWLEVAEGDILPGRGRANRHIFAYGFGCHIIILHHILVV